MHLLNRGHQHDIREHCTTQLPSLRDCIADPSLRKHQFYYTVLLSLSFNAVCKVACTSAATPSPILRIPWVTCEISSITTLALAHKTTGKPEPHRLPRGSQPAKHSLQVQYTARARRDKSPEEAYLPYGKFCVNAKAGTYSHHRGSECGSIIAEHSKLRLRNPGVPELDRPTAFSVVRAARGLSGLPQQRGSFTP
jgi:hypothetical protein